MGMEQMPIITCIFTPHNAEDLADLLIINEFESFRMPLEAIIGHYLIII